MSRLPVPLAPSAAGLRPVRLRGEKDLTLYTPTFFTKRWAGTELTLARMNCFGMFDNPHPDLMLDVLDENGDIVQDFAINRKGFEYLRRILRFRLDHEAMAEDTTQGDSENRYGE